MVKRIKELSNRSIRTISMAATAITIAMPSMVLAAPSFSEYNSGSLSGTRVVNGFAKFFATIGTSGGALYLIGAIFALVLAVRNEDTEGRNKAILNMLAAIALLSLGGIINLFGISSS